MIRTGRQGYSDLSRWDCVGILLLIGFYCCSGCYASDSVPFSKTAYVGITEAGGKLYLLTENLNDSALRKCRVNIYASTDDGLRWTTIAQQLPLAGHTVVRDIAADAVEGLFVLMANGVVQHIGAHGEIVETNTIGLYHSDFRRIWSLDGGRLVALRAASSNALGSLFVSNDAGKTWKEQYAAPDAIYGLSTSNPSPIFFKCVSQPAHFTNSKLFTSRDFGKTWSSLGSFPYTTLPFTDEAGPYNLFAAHEGTIVFAGSNDTGNPGMIYCSTDQGQQWVSYQAEPENGGSGSTVTDLPIIEDVLITERGIIVLLSNQIMVSTDGGLHWRRIARDHGFNRLFRSGTGKIWAIGTVVFISRDGVNWEESHFP
jgi:hypothetical protein